MYELDTPRLRIIPLTPAQCRMWLQSPRRLAEALGIRQVPPPRAATCGKPCAAFLRRPGNGRALSRG
ncbi:MAG: hypothetical protein V8Q84_05935 [Bilophila sp.]